MVLSLSLKNSPAIARGSKKAIVPPIIAIPKINALKGVIFLKGHHFFHNANIVIEIMVAMIDMGNQWMVRSKFHSRAKKIYIIQEMSGGVANITYRNLF